MSPLERDSGTATARYAMHISWLPAKPCVILRPRGPVRSYVQLNEAFSPAGTRTGASSHFQLFVTFPWRQTDTSPAVRQFTEEVPSAESGRVVGPVCWFFDRHTDEWQGTRKLSTSVFSGPPRPVQRQSRAIQKAPRLRRRRYTGRFIEELSPHGPQGGASSPRPRDEGIHCA